MKSKLIIIALCLLCSCTKEPQDNQDVLPQNYGEMFRTLNLQLNKEYSFVEKINNAETGNKGKVRFSLKDTSITETFGTYTTKDHFRLDSLKAYSCQFQNLGNKKYNRNTSVFINNARKTLSAVNGLTMVSFDSIENGSYYYYQYIIVP